MSAAVNSRPRPILRAVSWAIRSTWACVSSGFAEPSMPITRRLHAADRDECVAALRERVGDEVLELPQLVAAEREAGVAVVTLGPERCAAELLGQPFEPVDRGGAEKERIPLESSDPRCCRGWLGGGRGRHGAHDTSRLYQ